MMISPASTAPVRAQASLPASTPSQPSAPLDFSEIDTAEKAALMPALNLLNYTTFSGVITATAMSGVGLHGDLDMVFSQGDQQVELKAAHQLAAGAPGTIGIESNGTIGTAPFHEVWSYGMDEAIRIQGTIGKSEEDLTLRSDPKTGTSTMEGHLGSVPVHLVATQAGLSGTLGDKPVQETMTMDAGQTGGWKGTVQGTVGGAALNQEVRVTPDPQRKGMGIQGSGSVQGGVCYTLTQFFQPDFAEGQA